VSGFSRTRSAGRSVRLQPDPHADVVSGFSRTRTRISTRTLTRTQVQ